MASPNSPIEEIAAEEIAADQERSRDWVPPKVSAGTVWPVGHQSWLGRLQHVGALPWAGALVLLIIAVVVAFAFLRPGVTPSDPAVAVSSPTPMPTDEPTAEATPEPTDAPTQGPTATPTAVATSSPGGPPIVAADDATGDAVTDSGAPVDDPIVDIVGAELTRTSDGSLAVQVFNAAPMDPPSFSRAMNAVAGRTRLAFESGVILAQTQAVPLRSWFWQVHDGVLTTGSNDGQTARALATEALIDHQVEAGSFSFLIPAQELPDGAEWIWLFSFHMATADSERSSDEFGPLLLDAPSEPTT